MDIENKEVEESKESNSVTRLKRVIKRPARYDDSVPEAKKLAVATTQKKEKKKKAAKSQREPNKKNFAKKLLKNAMCESGKKIQEMKANLDQRIKDNPILEAARQTAASELSTSEESDVGDA